MTGDAGPAISLAQTLRESGLRVQLYGEQKKFKQKLAYANKLGVPYVVLLGEDELAAGKCALKDMRTGQQLLVTAQEAAQRIQEGTDVSKIPVILEK